MFFKKGLSPHQTALAMIGAKPGLEVVFLGSSNPALAAEVALVTGLNGRTTVVDRDASGQQRVQAAASEAGALVDYVDAPPTMLPLDSDTADLVVVDARLAARDGQARTQIVLEGVRVLKAGRRVVMIEGARRAGVFSVLSGKVTALADDAARTLLTAAGLTAVRHLADVDGVAYFEGRKGSS